MLVPSVRAVAGTSGPTTREWCGLLLAGLFFALFLSVELPNNRPVVRWQLLPSLPLLPFQWLDEFDPPETASTPESPGGLPRGWRYLGQRLPLWGAIATLALGSYGWGVWLRRRCVLDADLIPAERLYVAGLLGLSGVSLLVLGLGLMGLLQRWCLLSTFAVGWVLATRGDRQHPAVSAAGFITRLRQPLMSKPWRFRGSWGWLTVPFLVGLLLGGISPSTDFDVKAYHLSGPKEWFLAGRITFLEHNVYTSFPFLTEMLLLAGMVLYGDWYWGGLVGQGVLTLFAPLTAIGLWAAGRRWWSAGVGTWAAVIWLSTPWVFRMSIIAYAEGGLTAYTAGAILAGWGVPHALRTMTSDRPGATAAATFATGWCGLRGRVLLTGLLAGSAMACKYTGLLMSVLPVGVGLLVMMVSRLSPWRLAQAAAIYTLGVVLAVGPWLLKNTMETGNPVYPLAYSVFGGRDLDDELAAKWRQGHARPSQGSLVAEGRDLVSKAYDVLAVNDWQTPLIGAFLPLLLWSWAEGLRRFRARGAADPPPDGSAIFADVNQWRGATWLLAQTVCLFLVWWLATHHIDRFWVPLLPSAALLAALGVDAFRSVWGSRGAVSLLLLGWIFNLAFCSTGLVGYHVGLTDLTAARDQAARITGPEIAWLNTEWRRGRLPDGFRVLCVGEAQLFDAEFPYRYNVVFDRVLLEEWCREPVLSGSGPTAIDAGSTVALRSPAALRERFRQEGITHVLVNWREIDRYRQTYGYSEFVVPERFLELQQRGLLGTAVSWPPGLGSRSTARMSPGERASLERWAQALFFRDSEGERWTTTQLFPVVNTPQP